MSIDFKAFLTSLATAGPAAMFVITLADTAFLPTAQVVDLLIMTQAAAAPSLAWALGGFAVAGSTTGAMILYAIARGGGGWALRRSVSEEKLEKIREKLQRWDALALILPTAIPLPFAPMKIFLVAAGALGVSPIRAALAVAFARTLRYGLLILLGIYFGDQAWQVIRQNAVWVLLACLAALTLWLLTKRQPTSA